MSEITDKVLSSGLVDKHTAELMERFGMLPEGSAARTVQESYIQRSREQMKKLAREFAELVDQEHALRETALDLNRLRWMVQVTVRDPRVKIAEGIPSTGFVARVDGIIDRMGRYYFRPGDVQKEWFVPGYIIERDVCQDGKSIVTKHEVIAEMTELFAGEQVAAIQVSTMES
jgi:hypothetical protein